MAYTGRPKLSQRRIKCLTDVIKAGHSDRQACRECDVGKTAFYRWLNEAQIELDRIEKEGGQVRTERELHVTLLKAYEKATAEAMAGPVALIQKHSLKDWRAASWFLEKRFPQEWGEVRRVELTGADGGPIELMPARLLIAERLAQTNRRIVEAPRPVELPEALEG